MRRPAAWTDGQRVDKRADFREPLACRTPRDIGRVVIVQSRVSRDLRERPTHSLTWLRLYATLRVASHAAR